MSVFLGAHSIVSPLGFNSQDNFNALLNGQSALKNHRFDFSEIEYCCSKINDANLNAHFLLLSNPQQFTRLEKMCLLSIQDVVHSSGINLSDQDNLLILSTTKGNIDLLENKPQTISKERAYLHSFAKTIGDFFDCANTPLLVSNACISGLLAIIMAKRMIENKLYKNIVVCGGDIISEFTISGFRSFNAMSNSPCKPFDANRTGINLGEAASSILLSEDNISNILVTAGASANDANHISGPSREGNGLFQAINTMFSLTKKEKIDFISAHGTATEYNDDMESKAFARTNLNNVPLHSLKGYYGHTLGAAGVLESIVAIQSLDQNTLISSAGFEKAGTIESLNIIQETKKAEIKACLKTASGFGGCNAAAIFEKI